MTRAAPRPLAGLTVAERARGLAARYAGFLLAELGAEVTACGEVGDAPGDRVLGRRKCFVPAGRERWARLAASADMVLTDDLGAPLPDDRIACVVSAWGTSGLRRDDPFDEALLAAVAGVQTFQWSWSGDPVWLVTPVVSYMTGMLAALGTTAAWFAAQRGGPPQRLDVSALDAALTLNSGRFVNAPGWAGSLSEQGDPQGAYPTYGIYRTADGWLFVGALTPAFFVKLLTCLERVDLLADPAIPEHPLALADPAARRRLRAELEPIFRRRTTAEWMRTLREADVPCGPVRSRRECLEDDEALAGGHVIPVDDAVLGPTRQPGPPADFEVGAPGRSAPLGCVPRTCLDGIRVVDLTSFIAGPFCPRLLADLGADVVKVEQLEGDPMRRAAEMAFIGCQRGKRSLALQLKDPRSREILERLVRGADIVHHNLRMPAARKLGLDDASLRPLRPDLITCHTSTYGPRGPRKDWPGYDQMAQAQSGWEYEGAGIGNPPMWHRFGMMDHQCALASVVATLLAVYHRERTGEGQAVNASILGASLLTVSETIVVSGDRLTPIERLDGAQTGLSPRHRLYRCRDGWLAVAALRPAEIARFDAAFGAGDAEALAKTFSERSRAETLAGLREAGVPAAPALVEQGEAFITSAAHRARGLVVAYPHPVYGTLAQPGAFWSFGSGPSLVHDRPPPTIGQHGREVLAELAFTEAEIDAFLAAGVMRVSDRMTSG